MNSSGAQGGAWGAAPAASSSSARFPRSPVACQSDDNGAMPRTTQQLHPHREPVATRAAATVLLLRDAPDAAGAGGLEVLMTRRSAQASFAPGAYVFPGGGIDALAAGAGAHAAADRRATQSELQLTQAIAAIRESFEELALLLVRHASGPQADTQDTAPIAPPAGRRKGPGLRPAAGGRQRLPAGPLDGRPRPAAPLRGAVSGRPHARGANAGGRRGRAVRAAVGAPCRRAGTPRGRAVLHDLSDHPHAATPVPVCRHPGRARRRGARKTAVGKLPARRHPGGQAGALHGRRSTVRRTGAGLPRWANRASAPRADRAPGAAAEKPPTPDPPPPPPLRAARAPGLIAMHPAPADAEHPDGLWRAAGGHIRMIVCTHSRPDH